MDDMVPRFLLKSALANGLFTGVTSSAISYSLWLSPMSNNPESLLKHDGLLGLVLGILVHFGLAELLVHGKYLKRASDTEVDHALHECLCSFVMLFANLTLTLGDDYPDKITITLALCAGALIRKLIDYLTSSTPD